jgi:hypothetical protein
MRIDDTSAGKKKEDICRMAVSKNINAKDTFLTKTMIMKTNDISNSAILKRWNEIVPGPSAHLHLHERPRL